MRASPLHIVVALALAGCAAQPGGTAGNREASGQPRCPSPMAVYAGDTVYSVARHCGVSVRALIEANHLQAPYALAAGMRLAMPGGGSDHVVERGDTLSVLARRYRVDFQSLAAANGKTPPYTLKVGEHLRIPGGTATAAAGGYGNLVVASPNAANPAPAIHGVPLQPPLRTAAAPPPPQVPSAQRPAAAQPAPAGAQSAPAAVAAAVPPEPAAVTGRGFLWPVKGDVVLDFGPQPAKGQNNDGINIAAPKGSPVRAAENGVVAYIGNELKGFGNLILLKHADGWMTAYAHADQVAVRRGDAVKRGQQIATVGATGSVTAPQLHFEIRRGSEAVNPIDYLKDVIAAGSPDGPPDPG